MLWFTGRSTVDSDGCYAYQDYSYSNGKKKKNEGVVHGENITCRMSRDSIHFSDWGDFQAQCVSSKSFVQILQQICNPR